VRDIRATTRRVHRNGPSGWLIGNSPCRRKGKIGYQAEVVARPSAGNWFIECQVARRYVERRPVGTAAHEDVVDATAEVCRPPGRRTQWVARRDGMAGFSWVDRIPGVEVRDADTVERLSTSPEPHARGAWRRIEVADQHDMPIALRNELLDETCRCYGLLLALVFGPPGVPGAVRYEERGPDRIGNEDVREDGPAGVNKRRLCSRLQALPARSG
jgi:hypothetical protein